MKFLHLFKVYSLRNFVEHKLLVFACILSITLAAASTYFMSTLTDYYQEAATDEISMVNGNAAIKIQDTAYFQHTFSDDQIDYLTNLPESNYSTGRQMVTNVIVDNKIDNVFLNVIIKPKENSQKLEKDEILLSSKVAERFGVEVNDQLFVKLHSPTEKDRLFTVKEILPANRYIDASDTEMEYSESMIGNAWIYLPDEPVQNVAYLDSTNKAVIDETESVFSPNFSLRTHEQLVEKITPRINLSLQGLKLIGALTFIISGICVSCAFLFFVTQRMKDYVLMKVMGMKNKQVAAFILLELLLITSVGLMIGLIVGNIGSVMYLSSISDSTVTFFSLGQLKNMLAVTGLIYLETLIFALIPISCAQAISFQHFKKKQVNLLKEGRIKGSIFVVYLLLSVAVSLYLGTFLGFIYLLGLLILSLLVFGLSYVGIRIVSKLRHVVKNKYYLSFLSLKQTTGMIAFSTTIFTLSLIFILILIMVPNLIASVSGSPQVEKGSGVTAVYTTSFDSVAPVSSKLKDHSIKDYILDYSVNGQMLAVNDDSLETFISKTGVVDEFIPDTVANFEQLTINVSERSLEVVQKQELAKGQWLEDEKENQIVLNPYMYVSSDSYKIGDKLLLSIEGESHEFFICGLLKGNNLSKGIFGYINNSSLISQAMLQKSVPQFKFYSGAYEGIAEELLQEDPDGFLERDNDFLEIVKVFLDDQKAIFNNMIVVSIFSSLFLLVCIQFIVNYQRLNEYQIMFSFGLSNQKLRRIMFLEKMVISLTQCVTIALFIEPIRFLISSEFSAQGYQFNLAYYAILWVIITGINYCSYLLTQIKVGAARY